MFTLSIGTHGTLGTRAERVADAVDHCSFFLLAYETVALATERRTLSRMMYDWNNRWPFFSTLVGLVVGGLLVHFFWQYCPDIK